VAREEVADEGFVAQARENLGTFMKEPVDAAVWSASPRRLRFANVDLSQPDQYGSVREKVDPVAARYGGLLRRRARALSDRSAGGSRPRGSPRTGRGWCWRSLSARTSPPPGPSTTRSGPSSRKGRVYRIDHYLGKETVLNLLALRFANSLFTTNWDHNSVDHVQITVAEEVGSRGGGGTSTRPASSATWSRTTCSRS